MARTRRNSLLGQIAGALEIDHLGQVVRYCRGAGAGRVDDRIHAVERGGYAGPVLEVADNGLDFGPEALGGLGRVTHEGAHRVAFRLQLRDDQRPRLARGSRHEDQRFHAFLPGRFFRFRGAGQSGHGDEQGGRNGGRQRFQ